MRPAIKAVPARHTLAIMMAASGIAFSPLITFAELPSGGSVVNGQAVMQQAGNQLSVSQSTAQVSIDWQSFGIGSGSAVNFIQPSSSALAINRVMGSNASTIAGSLTANGRVVLINPNGVLFTPTAQVNVGSLVASTLKNIAQGSSTNTLELSGDSAASVVNQGQITAAQGGTIALIAAQVINTGSITAPGGHVALAAGNKVRLDVGAPLNLEIEEGAFNAYVEQGGVIRAEGGKVLITAKTLNDMVQTVINHTGITEAQTAVTGEKGEIILLGDMRVGRAEVSGRLDASAPNGGDGGFIETSAAVLDIKSDTQVRAGSAYGNPGLWLIDPVDILIAPSMGGNVSGDTIELALAGGSDVTISTAGSGSCTGITTSPSSPSCMLPSTDPGLPGDITISDSIVSVGTSPGTLTFLADRHIIMESGSLISSAVPLNVNLFSNQSGNGGAIVLETGAAIYSAGGDIILSGGANASGFATGFGDRPHGVEILGATLDASSGGISIFGKSIQGSPGDGVRIMGSLLAGGSISIEGISRATLSTPTNLSTPPDQAAGVRLGCYPSESASLCSRLYTYTYTNTEPPPSATVLAPSGIRIVGDASAVTSASGASDQVAGIVLEGPFSEGEGSLLSAGPQGEVLLKGIAPADSGYAVRLGLSSYINGADVALVGVGGDVAAIQIDDSSFINADRFLVAGKGLTTKAAASIRAREIYFDLIGQAEILSGMYFFSSSEEPGNTAIGGPSISFIGPEDPPYVLIRAGGINFKPSDLFGFDYLGLLSAGSIVIDPPGSSVPYFLGDAALIKGSNVTLNHPISAANVIDVVALNSFVNGVGNEVLASPYSEGIPAGPWRLWLPGPAVIGPEGSGLTPDFIEYNSPFPASVLGLPSTVPTSADSSLFSLMANLEYDPPVTEVQGSGIFYSARSESASTETSINTITNQINSIVSIFPTTSPIPTFTNTSVYTGTSTGTTSSTSTTSQAPSETPQDAEDQQDPTLASLGEPEQPEEAENEQRSNEKEVTVSPGLITVRVPIPPRPQGEDASEQRFSFQGNSSLW